MGKARRSIGRIAGLAAPAWVLAFLAVASPPVLAGDWPQFRGPNRDGVAVDERDLGPWPEGGPRELWRVPLGAAYSAVAVVGERLYTLESRDGREYVVALAAADGSRSWSYELGKAWGDRWSKGPRSTPTVDDGVVFAVGSKGKLAALAAADGKELWSVDLVVAHHARIPQWGIAASPLVHAGRVILPIGAPGALLVALDRKTGKAVWRSGNDRPAYAAPIVVEAAGVEQVVAFSASGVVGVPARGGRPLWTFAWKTSYDVNAATPVFVPPDRLFVSSGYDTGAAVIRMRADEGGGVVVDEVWRNREMKNQFSSAVLYGDHVYGFDDKTLKCLDVRNGETRWKKRGFGHGSLVRVGSRLIVLGDAGKLALIEASPEGYREHGGAAPFDGKTWTMPVVADGRMYLRDERTLAAFDLRRGPDDRDASAPPGNPDPLP